MAIKRPAVPQPENVQLGEGVLVFDFNPENWEDESSIPFGAVRGGGSYSFEPTNKPIRFDGDKGESTKGFKRRTEFVITISATALELDHDKLEKYVAGTTEHIPADDAPAHTKFRPAIDFEDEHYFDNLAYITETNDGRIVAYVIENALADGSFSAAMADKDEIASEVTFTAHFDPKNMDTVPTYIVHYDAVKESR